MLRELGQQSPAKSEQTIIKRVKLEELEGAERNVTWALGPTRRTFPRNLFWFCSFAVVVIVHVVFFLYKES